MGGERVCGVGPIPTSSVPDCSRSGWVLSGRVRERKRVRRWIREGGKCVCTNERERALSLC